MISLKNRFFGVSFESLRFALTTIYHYKKGMTEEEFNKKKELVIPMQQNWEIPTNDKGEVENCYIQYWINEDEKLTFDWKTNWNSQSNKIAHITLRFIGVDAEYQAKLFHHLYTRGNIKQIFAECCGANNLEYVSPIKPINMNIFSTGNSVVAYQLTFKLHYIEELDVSEDGKVDGDILKYVSFADGDVTKF